MSDYCINCGEELGVEVHHTKEVAGFQFGRYKLSLDRVAATTCPECAVDVAAGDG